MAPPNPILQPPEKRPVIPRKQASSDDLQAVIDADAAESRARAAMKLLEEEHQARAAAEQYNANLEERLKQLANAPVTVAEAKSMRPGMLHFRGKDWKLAIPFTVLIAVVPWAWTVVQHVQGVLQQLIDLNKTVAGYADSQDARDSTIAKLQGEVVELRVTQAKLSGYLARALPLAGVSVPGAEVGAIDVDIDKDSEPLGTKHRPKIVTHTRVPAPAPAP